LRATTNLIDDALKKLKINGINATILSGEIYWNEHTALCITFDTTHPLGSLAAIETLWFTLIEAFRPDRDKIVRSKAIEWFWEKIVLVPLVQGRSLEKQALANMDAVAYPLHEDPKSQAWRFIPEPIPEAMWRERGLPAWDRQVAWETFDKFATAYGGLFQHVDHMADFMRCKIDLDELGKEIFQSYVKIEEKRAEPFLQTTFDSCGALLNQFPRLDESVVAARPNILNCMRLIVDMRSSIRPSEDFDEKARLTIEAIAAWRNRLKDGFNNLGLARSLWIADSLGLDGFSNEQ
jgi:hypothetical protein